MIGLAQYWSQFSTCKKRQVGAVIYDPNTYAVLSIGYNDTPIGEPDCGDGGCDRCNGVEAASLYLDCLCCHAEMNAVMFAARRGIAIEGARLALWTEPMIPSCSTCMKYLKQAGVE